MIARARWRRVAREPLLWLVLGSALFFGLHAQRPSPESPDPAHTIVLDEAFVDALAADSLSRDEARRAHVRQEVLVREARALGLDLDDVIVRRQLLRRMEGRASAEPRVVSRETEPTLRFEHVFFSRTRRGARALSDAQEALARDDVGPGDPFLHGAAFDPIAPSRLDRLMGAGFAASVTPLLEPSAPPRWRGPVESAYGGHLIRRLP